MNDQFPRPPADKDEQEACETMGRFCPEVSAERWQCTRPQAHAGDHVHGLLSNRVIARWPQAPAAEPAEVVPLNTSRVVAEARRICARAEERGETSAEIVTLAGELRSMDAGMAGETVPLRGKVMHRSDDGWYAVAFAVPGMPMACTVYAGPEHLLGAEAGDKVTLRIEVERE